MSKGECTEMKHLKKLLFKCVYRKLISIQIKSYNISKFFRLLSAYFSYFFIIFRKRCVLKSIMIGEKLKPLRYINSKSSLLELKKRVCRSKYYFKADYFFIWDNIQKKIFENNNFISYKISISNLWIFVIFCNKWKKKKKF